MSKNGGYGWCQLIGKCLLVIFVVNHAAVSTGCAWSQLDFMLGPSLLIEEEFCCICVSLLIVTSYAVRYLAWATPDQQVIQEKEKKSRN